MIDLLQFHAISNEQQIHDITTKGALEVALEAREQGRIRYINFTGQTSPALHLHMNDGRRHVRIGGTHRLPSFVALLAPALTLAFGHVSQRAPHNEQAYAGSGSRKVGRERKLGIRLVRCDSLHPQLNQP